MPTFREITITVQSQYDAETIPEDPLSSRASVSETGSSNNLRQEETVHPANLPRTTEVSIPTYPSSQFWIRYSCRPPAGRLSSGDEVRYYYFKLIIAGKCVVSWGIGEEEGWSGKTVYAPFTAGTDFEGKKVVEKRGLFFPNAPAGIGGGGFEIRVYRAKARRREGTRYESFKGGVVAKEAGVDLTNIGRVKRGERQRMYTYALIDPKDEPYVTFKYKFQTDDNGTGACSELSRPASFPDDNEETLSIRKKAEICGLRRLSVPPQLRLYPSTSSREPWSPTKKAALSERVSRRESVDSAEIKRRDWVIRTPSPMVARLFDRPATPPSERKKVGSAALLKSVVGHALQRKT